jgi:rare lipoprotein A
MAERVSRRLRPAVVFRIQKTMPEIWMPMSINRHATVWLRRISATCAVLASWLAVPGLIAATVISTEAEAKTPGSTYCFYGVCHRVKSIAETQALVGKEEAIQTSFYDDCKNDKYNPCGLTSSGERFNPDEPDNAASPIYPDGTTLLLWNPETEKAAVVRVNNAGPYWGKRTLDVSRATAERLGFKGRGTAKLKVRVMKAPKPAEAKYRRNRKYKPVPGDIGRYESADAANAGANAFMALEKMATALLAPITGGAMMGHPSEPTTNVAEAVTQHVKTRTASRSSRARSSRRYAKSHRGSKSARYARAKSRKRVYASRRAHGKSRVASKSRSHRGRYASASHRSRRHYSSTRSQRRYGSARSGRTREASRVDRRGREG